MDSIFKRLIRLVCLLVFLGGILFFAKRTEVTPVFKVEANFLPEFKIEEITSFQLPPQQEEIIIVEEKEKSILFTGDSRFVGMSQVENNDEVFLAESGKGFSYFCSLQDLIKNENSDIVIVGFGVNDLYNVEKYVDFLNSDAISAKIYFLTVNPVDEKVEKKYGYSVKNEDINEFNDYIKRNAIHYNVIDTNSYLWEIGFETKDGLHYRDETYQNIYDYIIKELR